MKGLLLKDFYVLKKELRAFLFIVVFFTAFSFLGDNNSFFMFYECIKLDFLSLFSTYALDLHFVSISENTIILDYLKIFYILFRLNIIVKK